MFEEFEFEDMSEDGKVYCESLAEFKMMTSVLPIDEVGISFNGEIKIDEKTSVITDKQIKLDNPEEAKKTYLKVMEMRELTEAERLNVSKAKLILKKLFDVFFKGQKFRRNLTIFWLVIVGLDIAAENYFGALTMTACILLYNSPIKFIKEIKKMYNKKRRLELEKELTDMKMLGHVNLVDEDEGIRLYYKPKSSNG
jgi:hypothetical protein